MFTVLFLLLHWLKVCKPYDYHEKFKTVLIILYFLLDSLSFQKHTLKLSQLYDLVLLFQLLRFFVNGSDCHGGLLYIFYFCTDMNQIHLFTNTIRERKKQMLFRISQQFSTFFLIAKFYYRIIVHKGTCAQPKLTVLSSHFSLSVVEVLLWSLRYGRLITFLNDMVSFFISSAYSTQVRSMQ